jgi:hypothetical protein
MATLTDAERARAQKAEFLRQLGAHAISVEPVDNLTDEEAKGTAGEAGKARKANAAGIGKRSTSRGNRSNVQTRKTADFAVIAYFEEAPKEPLPETLEVWSGKRRLKVPLGFRLAPRFRLE